MKKVLLLTYYFPPSGKASLHLPLAILKHLPSYGWEPTVMTVNEDSFSQKDESLLKEVPDNLRVIKTNVFEPFAIYKKFLGKKKDEQLVASETISKEITNWRHKLAIWIRMNLFIPDARTGWAHYAIKAGKKLLKKEHFDAVVTIGPPHTTTYIGMKLSKKTGVPFYPVFIDPWVDIVYYQGFKRSAVTLAIDKRMERKALEQAKEIIYVTRSMKEGFLQRYPEVQHKSHVLYWGYNEENFDGLEKQSSNNEKILLHAGNIFDYQNPVNFWNSVKHKIDQAVPLKLKFIGTVSPGIKKAIEENGLAEYTEYLGFLPYKDAVQEMLNADYLLMCATEKYHVPGKLFEYLRTGNPIIAFGKDNREVEEILHHANAGQLYQYDHNALGFFEDAKDFRTDMGFVNQFDRKQITGKLAMLMNKRV